MDFPWKDFSVAIRQFRRQPGFALAVVSTLALAIGANLAVFSVVNAVLFRALPFTAPERLVWITSVRPDNPAAPFTLPEFMDYRSQARTLSGISAYTDWTASLAGFRRFLFSSYQENSTPGAVHLSEVLHRGRRACASAQEGAGDIRRRQAEGIEEKCRHQRYR